MMGQPRIFYSMARDGLLPAAFARLHPRFQTPFLPTILTGLVVGVLSSFASIDEVVDLTNIGTLFAFVLVSIGVVVLRRTRPDLQRSFRTPAVPLVPALSVLACLFLMLNLGTHTWIRFLVWMAIGLVVYALYGSRRSRLSSRQPATAGRRDGS
jgi:APA family basic amino acid/polyamine antiporter